MPIFTSGIVLLLNIWGGKRSGININPMKEMEDVHRCMSVLSQSEKKYSFDPLLRANTDHGPTQVALRWAALGYHVRTRECWRLATPSSEPQPVE